MDVMQSLFLPLFRTSGLFTNIFKVQKFSRSSSLKQNSVVVFSKYLINTFQFHYRFLGFKDYISDILVGLLLIYPVLV